MKVMFITLKNIGKYVPIVPIYHSAIFYMSSELLLWVC